jgi:hypothetical protein
MRKIIAALTIAATIAIVGAGAAGADPAFGPGNNGGGDGNSTPTGPADPKCHPPGQTVEVPGCK